MNVRARILCAISLGLAMLTSSHAAELLILTGQGATPGIAALGAAFEKATGHKIVMVEESGARLEARLQNGPADLTTAMPDQMEALVKKGRVVADSVKPYMTAPLGVSVRAGAPKPDISTVEAYKSALINAKSIGYSRGCSGQHVAEGIEKLGLAEQLKSKVQLTGGGTGPVTFFLARGDFEIGVQQTNIMVGQPGTDFVGDVPAPVNKPCPNSIGLLTVSKQQEAARAMIAFMTSPAAAPILRGVHEEPATK